MGHNGNRVVLNTANTASATASITSMASSSSSTHRRVSSSNNLYLPHSYPQQTIFFNSSSSTATTSATAGKTSQHYDFSTSTTATNNYLLAKAISAPCSPSRTSVLSSRYSRQLIMPPSQYLQNKRPSMIAQQRAEREKSLPPLSDIRANLSYHADAAITLVGMSSAMIDNSWGAPDVVSRVFSNVLPVGEKQ